MGRKKRELRWDAEKIFEKPVCEKVERMKDLKQY